MIEGSRHKAHEEEQILPLVIENVLEKWAQRMGDHGFPPRLENFKAIAQELAQQNAELRVSQTCKTCEDMAARVLDRRRIFSQELRHGRKAMASRYCRLLSGHAATELISATG